MSSRAVLFPSLVQGLPCCWWENGSLCRYWFPTQRKPPDKGSGDAFSVAWDEAWNEAWDPGVNLLTGR